MALPLTQLLFLLLLIPSSAHASNALPPLQVLLDRPPLQLNPRQTVDVTGQRLGALMFRSLTRIQTDLRPEPDLAEKWEVRSNGRTWAFQIRPHLVDHEGEPITPEKLVACLENYRVGTPTSAYLSSFPGWSGTHLGPHREVLIDLKHPSPYLARNLSLLRYFRVLGEAQPCTEPSANSQITTSGKYKPAKWNATPETDLLLIPSSSASPSVRALHFKFVADDHARLLHFLRGDADVIQNGLSLTKVRWLMKKYPNRFQLLERDGVGVSYLAFNTHDPLLKNPQIRRAIALSIDRKAIIQNKLFGFGTLAESLLSPKLEESVATPFPFNPQEAESLLDRAGLPRPQPGAMRFTLKYRTTPAREGIETALLIQEMLKKVGIELQIDSVEPAVFINSIKKGHFQLYSSRWIGISDGSILYRTLRSGQGDNRVRYQDAQMDHWLDEMVNQTQSEKRIPWAQKVQKRMMEELPYFPLWFWNNALLARKDLKGLSPNELSLSGGLEPLGQLH